MQKPDMDFEKVLPRPQVKMLWGRHRISPHAIIEQWVRGVARRKGRGRQEGGAAMAYTDNCLEYSGIEQ
jgi:hypothetical protein